MNTVIRLVTGGRQIMPSIAFRSQPKGRTSAVHVIFPLHGGGGNTEPADDLVSLLTRTMCLQGAEQDESQAFAQKIVAQLGAARIRRVCTDTRPDTLGRASEVWRRQRVSNSRACSSLCKNHPDPKL